MSIEIAKKYLQTRAIDLTTRHAKVILKTHHSVIPTEDVIVILGMLQTKTFKSFIKKMKRDDPERYGHL